MKIVFKKSESTVSPALLDTTSSNDYVYIRKNVQQKTREEESGETSTYYEYDEAVLTNAEYEMYQSNTDVQLALAELGELIAGLIN